MLQFEDSNGKNLMFEKLHEEISSEKELSKYMLFDEASNTVWVMWYE